MILDKSRDAGTYMLCDSFIIRHIKKRPDTSGRFFYAIILRKEISADRGRSDHKRHNVKSLYN